MDLVLKKFVSRFFRFDWKFGLILVVLICVPRFLLVLNANKNGSYGSIGIIMLLSALAPFLFLNRNGRREIGIKKPQRYSWLLIAFIIGLLFSIILYYLGKSFYGNTYENWYQYIGKSYKIPAGISGSDKTVMFTVVAITGMIFSPIGEEFFFRGIVHGAFSPSILSRISISLLEPF